MPPMATTPASPPAPGRPLSATCPRRPRESSSSRPPSTDPQGATMRRRILLSLSLAFALGLSAHVRAQSSGDIEFRNIAEVEVEVKTPEGKVEKKRVPP